MRRAEARRSASVMINSSIRWSLAGYDVDWITNTSEPRTFSWISTKISMSAKRRTTAFVGGMCSQSAICCARAGLELPATSLIEPFLADIDASPRALLETMFSISGYPQNRRVSTGEVISRSWLGWQPVLAAFSAQIGRPGSISLTGAAVTERADAECAGIGGRLSGACHCGAAFARRRRRRWSIGHHPVDHAAEAAQAGLGDFPQHQIVGGHPRIAPGLAGRLLAAEPQRALLVGVVDVPDP